MPYLVLAVALLVLSGPVNSGPLGTPTNPRITQTTPSPLILAFDDEVYGESDNDDDDTLDPDDRDYSYGDDGDDDDDDSAHGPDNDDDGWDMDEYERSERA